MSSHMLKLMNIFKFDKFIKFNRLGRWETNVPTYIKDRRVDLANIDSCGDEVCSNPQKMIIKYNFYESKLNNKLLK